MLHRVIHARTPVCMCACMQTKLDTLQREFRLPPLRAAELATRHPNIFKFSTAHIQAARVLLLEDLRCVCTLVYVREYACVFACVFVCVCVFGSASVPLVEDLECACMWLCFAAGVRRMQLRVCVCVRVCVCGVWLQFISGCCSWKT